MSNAQASPRFHGPLRVCPINPRYFTDESGQPIYLTGSHTWANLIDIQGEGDPPFDYDAYLDLMQAHGHNFMRMWAWGHPDATPWTVDKVTFSPLPYARTGPGLALDGQPKFDLGRYNEDYFRRLRQRVIAAGERGIYVSIMLFEAWCIVWAKPGQPGDPWPHHPYNVHNNVNGVNGDPNGDGKAEIYSLQVPAVVEFQQAYVRQVIDTVNDLDNVLYEIINELRNDEHGLPWQCHMIDYIHAYERQKPKQHPVGLTAQGGDQHNPDLFPTPADWISPGHGPHGEYQYDPPAGDGRKVILTDTDHLWGHGGTYQWAWKSMTRGLNPLFMDPWWPLAGRTTGWWDGPALNQRDYPDWEPLRLNLGYTRRYAQRLDLRTTLPHGELAASGYCLADPGRAYLVYSPYDGRTWVDLSAAEGELQVEWFYPRTGETLPGGTIKGGGKVYFVSPFGMDAVLFIHK